MNSKNITIGKIILSVIAIGVLFIPAIAVQQIESRNYTHIMEVEGNYVDGTAFEFGQEITEDDQDILENSYRPDDVYGTDLTNDSAFYGRASWTNEVMWYGERITYLGNGTYNVAVNQTEVPASTYTASRVMILNTNLTYADFLEYDFIRVTVTEGMPEPIFIVKNSYQPLQSISSPTQISDTEYLFVLSMYSKSVLAASPDTEVWLAYGSYWTDIFPDDITEFDFKIQGEVLEGADVLTWDDETLYVITVLLCDVLLIGAIVFASDPIDILIDRKYKRR